MRSRGCSQSPPSLVTSATTYTCRVFKWCPERGGHVATSFVPACRYFTWTWSLLQGQIPSRCFETVKGWRAQSVLMFKNISSWAAVLNEQTAAGSPWQLQEDLGLFFIGEKCTSCAPSSCAANAVQHRDFHGDGGIAYCWGKDVNLKERYDWSQNAAQGARHCYAKKCVFQPSATATKGCHC